VGPLECPHRRFGPLAEPAVHRPRVDAGREQPPLQSAHRPTAVAAL
jgi:hypothetical protein